MTILFPLDYSGTGVDRAFTDEYNAAIENDISVIFFDQKLWDTQKQVKIDSSIPKIDDTVIYRGWMMKPEEYRVFYQLLSEKSIYLLTIPDTYERFHLFPNIYKYIKKDTPPILQFSTKDRIDVAKIEKSLGDFMIKDSVKSAKNTDFPKYFKKDTSQHEFDCWMKRFYEIRGKLFTGDIIAKKYVPLKQYAGKTNEFRVFYLNGFPISISRNSLQDNITPMVPDNLVNKYSNLPSLFYTVDYAELENGAWVIIEAGDGGVSGPSPDQNLFSFYRNIKITMNKEDYIQEIE